MADLALLWDPDELVADMGIQANDLVQEDSLKTAVLLSLYLDRQAEVGDQLPPGETSRRGWWADGAPVVAGDLVGSRLWLLAREKQSPAVRARAERYAREALQWLIEDRVVERLEVTASFPKAGWWALAVEIFRPSADPVRFQFDGTWAEPAAAAAAIDFSPAAGVVTSASADVVTSTGTYLTSE